MVVQLSKAAKIEALRPYPSRTMDQLARLLAAGAPARPDPRRANFFELESDSEIFYVHISPASGRVLLIGVWQRSALPRTLTQAVQVVA